MNLLSATAFQFTDTIPWIIAFAAVVVALYYGQKNYRLNLEKRREEKRKHDLEEGARARAGWEEKTAFDHYRTHIYERFKNIDFTGLNAYQKKLPLERVYIRLRAKKEYKLEQYSSIRDFEKLKEEIQEKETEKEKGEHFSEVFIKSLKEAENKDEALRLLISGHPGSGKTTLFKWIALQCVKSVKLETDAFFNNYIPVFISLKDFTSNPEWLKGDLEDLVLSSIGRENLDAPFFKERFERSEIIFLLDGLDEVADEDLRRDVIAWIEKQSIRRNRLLVSSRFSGLNHQKGLVFNADFNPFVITDLDEADIEQFLHKWYEAIETIIEDSEENRKEAKRQADELINVIKSKGYEPLRRIAVNPLLLTIVAIVRRNRAKLPKERHKLYEDCLNVMIELWHVSNKRLKVFFPAEVCKNNLSRLAHHAMLHNKREITRQEITELLPAEIEGQPLTFFLNEMVLKAGLLYESEGKYGFLHLTFQEYLTAWHYARSSQPLDILQHRDQAYWAETIKLFVNLGNARQFFEEIITGLNDKYWQNMNLWDECLGNELIDDKVKEEIEKQTAEKVCEILLGIPYEESEELKIYFLCSYVAVYKHAIVFEKQGWQLFLNAKHQYIKTVGASILGRCNKETQAQFFNELISKINQQPSEDSLGILFEYDNTFLLLLSKRGKILDFSLVLFALKGINQLLILLALKDLDDLLQMNFEGWRDLFYLQSQGFNFGIDSRLFELQELLALMDLMDLLDLMNLQNLWKWVAVPYLLGLRYLYQQYQEKYKAILLQHQPEIHAWADQALQKLQDLSDEEVLKYFPGTTEEELSEFRVQKAELQ